MYYGQKAAQKKQYEALKKNQMYIKKQQHEDKSKQEMNSNMNSHLDMSLPGIISEGRTRFDMSKASGMYSDQHNEQMQTLNRDTVASNDL